MIKSLVARARIAGARIPPLDARFAVRRAPANGCVSGPDCGVSGAVVRLELRVVSGERPSDGPVEFEVAPRPGFHFGGDLRHLRARAREREFAVRTEGAGRRKPQCQQAKRRRSI